MAGYLEHARLGAYKVVAWQGLAAVLAGIVGILVGGFRTGEWACLGGLIAALANLAMVSRVFGGRLERDPKRFLGRIILGETLKFAVTVLLFAVAIVVLKAAFLPLILGYLAGFAAYWFGFMKVSIGQAR